MLYVLHFSEKIHHAGHYTGSCADGRLEQRLLEHRNGFGARLTQVAVERGITLQLGATLPGSYLDERALKNQHNGPRHCAICRQQRLLEKMFK
jgi:predicted GIY-YIG superfamily endonuclease